MPITFKINTTPTAGSVVSIPVAFDMVKANYYHETVAPADAGALAWNDSEFLSPIARGDRAHLFVVDCPLDDQGNPYPGTVFPDQYKLDILSTIQSIKSQQLPLTDWMEKMANAYTFDYANPYTSGIIVGLSNDDQNALESQFTAGRITPTNEYPGVGVMTIHHYGGNGYSLAYYGLSELPFGSNDWLQDGFDKNNMYTGYFKDRTSGDVKQVSINKLKSAFAPADVNNHQIEAYRGLRFYTDPGTGNLKAGTILVIVDWADTDTYTLYDSDNQPYTTTGPKAIFALSAANAYSTFDSSYSGAHTLDVYAASPSSEFEFIPYSNGGGGGGGNNGRGGRAVTSDIPMRITSRNDVDYRHFLDLYDETNYPERNMFLTNFVGRIPYKLVDYDSSESGGTGVIRVSTNLQFTHFVGASFSDANVPRVYEVISHKSMGGSPNVLLCTFRVCHLKDYFQHFGVTSENEFLVMRSTASSLYNPWLKDSRMLAESVTDTRWEYGSGGFNFAQNSVLITLTDGRAIVLSLEIGPSPGYSHSVVPSPTPGEPETYFYGTSTFGGLLACINDVDSDPLSTLYETSFVNAVLSKIKGVYLVSSQMISGLGASGHIQTWVDMSYYTDPTDPENTMVPRRGIFDLSGIVIDNPRVPISYTTGYMGSASFSDWTDLEANYQLLIPWYGVVELSGVEFKRIVDAGEGTIGVQYLISPLDGTITIAIGGTAGRVIRSWKTLPRLAMPASSRTLAYKQAVEQSRREAEIRDSQTGISSFTAIGAGVVGGAVALATGNPVAAALSVGGGIATAVGANISNDLRDRSAMIGTDIARSNIVFNSTACDGFEMMAIQNFIVIKVKRNEILNVYNTIGYPCRALWRSVGAVDGLKYWVSILGTIRGTSAYAQAVRGEIERDGIIYNYS